MAKCTGCGYPNEYQESDYLCSQCKMMGSVFGCSPPTVELIVKEGLIKTLTGEIRWTKVLIAAFDTAHPDPPDSICACGSESGDHRSKDNCCFDEDVGEYRESSFYNEIAERFCRGHR